MREILNEVRSLIDKGEYVLAQSLIHQFEDDVAYIVRNVGDLTRRCRVLERIIDERMKLAKQGNSGR